MIHLVYASSATREMNNEDLLTLLEQSRARNQRQNVTGMLLYVGGSFIQVLEGEEKDLDEIYESIFNDERNVGNILMLKEKIDKREFPDWSMGFKQLSKKDTAEIQGFTEFLERELTPQNIADNPGNAINLLFYFKKFYS